MRPIHLITFGLPFYQKAYDRETKASIYLRIIAVVLGVLTVVVGALVLFNAFGWNQLGVSRGWCMIPLGALLGLGGIFLKYVERSSLLGKALREYTLRCEQQTEEIMNIQVELASYEAKMHSLNQTFQRISPKLQHVPGKKEHHSDGSEKADLSRALIEMLRIYPKLPKGKVTQQDVMRLSEERERHHNQVLDYFQRWQSTNVAVIEKADATLSQLSARAQV